MGNDLNYKSLYLTNYKKLPIYFFYGTLIFLAIDSVIAGIAIFIQNDYFWVLLLTILGGWLISLGIALYVYWMSSVIISQRVVVADTLLAMHENKESGSSSTKEQNVVFQKTTPKDNTQQDTISQKTITDDNIPRNTTTQKTIIDDNIPKNTIPQKDAVKQSSETDRQKLQEQQKIDTERRKQIELRKALMMSRRNSNLCQHCGGSFKGLFTKTCESCGNPKDY